MLAMVVIFSLCQGSLLAEPQNRLDVRTMADWSIVVAETVPVKTLAAECILGSDAAITASGKSSIVAGRQGRDTTTELLSTVTFKGDET